jgi:hypothetical protein
MGSCLSSSLTVQSGVAQGCPLSPFLYAVFVDGMLESVPAECADSRIRARAAMLVLQAYADVHSAASWTPVGLQRILDAMKRYGDTGGCCAKTDKAHICEYASSWWALRTRPLTLAVMNFTGAPHLSQWWTNFDTKASG